MLSNILWKRIQQVTTEGLRDEIIFVQFMGHDFGCTTITIGEQH